MVSDDAAREEWGFEQLMTRVGELFEAVQEIQDENVQLQVLELLDLLEAYHREGITRLAMSVPPDVLQAAHEDPLVSHLLEAYLADEDGADPGSLVDDALAEIRPYVHSHGGEMEVVDVSNGVVTLRLLGACDGCPASDATLTQGVEGILRDKWPGFRQLRVEGEEGHSHGPAGGGGQQGLLQIQSLKRREG